jgi:protocatechuate 3,4-dioxygenase beta subunit
MQRTASQTIGPFFHEALRWRDGERVQFAERGTAIVLTGRLLDGAGQTLADFTHRDLAALAERKGARRGGR